MKKKKTFEKILSAEKKFSKGEMIIVGTGFFLMFVMCLIQVVCRFALHVSTPWAEESVRYMFIAISFLGTGVAIMRHEHIEIDILDVFIGKNPDKNKRLLFTRIIDIFRYSAVVIVLFIVAYYGFEYTMGVFKVNQVTAAAQIPMWILHGAVCVGYITTILHSAIRIVETVVQPKDPVNGMEVEG